MTEIVIFLFWDIFLNLIIAHILGFFYLLLINDEEAAYDLISFER